MGNNYLVAAKKSVDPKDADAMKLKTDWNKYQDWLTKKGVAGSPSLDKGVGDNNLGVQYLKMYMKENPTTTLSPQRVAEVQNHFKNYRDYAINEIKNKRATFDGDPDTQFMPELSKIDNIPGSFTTRHKFPSEFLTTIYKAPNGTIEKKTVDSLGLYHHLNIKL